MPYVEMPDKEMADDENPRRLFRRYDKPCELLDRSFYERDEFNRYRITRLEHENLHVEELANIIRQQPKSCLVILNTINDTKQVYDALTDDTDGSQECEVVLLNTHFTPNDRRGKIDLCQSRLKDRERVVLISTQLIEAGVDIDFPVLYRDMCPLPNLIQSAGRCNRNGIEPVGEVFLSELKKENGKASASYIYGRDLEWFLDFTKKNIKGTVTEKEMSAVQLKFFQKVGEDLHVGLHKQGGNEINMVRCINHMAFDDLGKFRLIDDEAFGTEFRYYIKDDSKFEELQNRVAQLDYRIKEFNEIARLKSKVEEQLRRMAGDIITIRFGEHNQESAPKYSDEALSIRKLADPDDYSSVIGIKLSSAGGCII